MYFCLKPEQILRTTIRTNLLRPPHQRSLDRLASVRRKGRHSRLTQDFAADAAKSHLADPRVAIPAHNQQITLMIRHAREQFGAYTNTACLANFFADLHVNLVQQISIFSSRMSPDDDTAAESRETIGQELARGRKVPSASAFHASECNALVELWSGARPCLPVWLSRSAWMRACLVQIPRGRKRR